MASVCRLFALLAVLASALFPCQVLAGSSSRSLIEGAWELRTVTIDGQVLSATQWMSPQDEPAWARRVLVIDARKTLLRAGLSLPALGELPLICEAETSAASSIGPGRLRIKHEAEGGATVWTAARTKASWAEAALSRGCSVRLEAGVQRWTIDGDGSVGDTMTLVEGDLILVYTRLAAEDAELNPVGALEAVSPEGAPASAPELDVDVSFGEATDATPLSDLARELRPGVLAAHAVTDSPAARATVDAYRRGVDLMPDADDAAHNQIVQANALLFPWPGFEPDLSVATPRGSACADLELPPRTGSGDGIELIGEEGCALVAGSTEALRTIIEGRVDGARVNPLSIESAWSIEQGWQRDLSAVPVLAQVALVTAELAARSRDPSLATSTVLGLLRFITDLERGAALESRASTHGPKLWLLRYLQGVAEDPATDPAMLKEIVRSLAEEAEHASFGQMMRTEVFLMIVGAQDTLRELDIEGVDPALIPTSLRGTSPPAENLSGGSGVLNYGVAAVPVWRALLSFADAPPPERRRAWPELDSMIAATETPLDWLLEAGDHPIVCERMQQEFDLVRRWDTRISYAQTRHCLVLHGTRAALFEARRGTLPASLAELEAELPSGAPSCDVDPLTREPWALRTAGGWRLTSPAADPDRAEELGLWVDAPARLTFSPRR
ncbi:MAG: hypothetical protein GY898_00530 [Proteobacteria bacterium]|nr:hypothetical protein [Pseudomonadota bacterium]